MRSALEERDRNEADALERDLHSKDDTSISLPGRLSGDKEWRLLRSELGSDGISSLSSSSCPVRKCIDEHVTKIYNALSLVIIWLVDQSYSKSRAVEVLNIFRIILVNVKKSPFRKRTASINSASNDAQNCIHQMLPYFGELLDALSLKCETDATGKVDVCLAADPVKTAVALPVLFHALDDVIYNVNQCNNFNKESLSWPLLKLNKICSGLVLASGEELPFGIVSCISLYIIHNILGGMSLKISYMISLKNDFLFIILFNQCQVTSAFDGTRMSKWEEPNGARGMVNNISAT